MKSFLTAALIAALASIPALAGFSLTVYAPKAPPTIPLLKAASGTGSIKISLYDDVQSQVLPRILKKEQALFIIPSNLAVKLRTKDPAIRLVGVTSLGLLSLVSADPSVSGVKDLRGKAVAIGDPGSSPDAVSRILFARAGVRPKIVYSSSPEIARQFLGGRIDTAVLPEHAATLAVTARTNARRIAEWKTVWAERFPGSPGIPQTALVTRSEFLDGNGKAVRELVARYRDAVDWCRKFPARASRLGIRSLGLKVPPAVVERSIPHMNLVFLSGKTARKDLLDYFRALAAVDGALTGNPLPDESDPFFAE